jgi:hypothetical protein
MVGNSYLLGDYGRVALDLSLPPSMTAAVVERAIRNEFPDAPCQTARGFHQAFLNHFALCSSEMRVDSNSKSRYPATLFKGSVIMQTFKFHPTGVSLFVVSSFATIAALLAASVALPLSAATSSSEPNFGQSVYIFNPSMSLSTIQATVDAVASEQVSNQFGTQRYALLFEPGTYGSSATPLIFQVGYYTTVAGLGLSPSDVTINGEINVSNQCFGPGNCTALVNFWRSLSNLTINVTSASNCTASAEFWAVSQAAPIRRVQINGNLFLFDYCSGPGFASGGFIADSQFTSGTIINATQQQWITRNSNIDGWTNGVWNQVFSGVVGAPAQCFPQVARAMKWTVHDAGDQPRDARGAVPVRGPRWELQRLRPRGAAQLRGCVMGRRRNARLVHPNREVLHCPADRHRCHDQ